MDLTIIIPVFNQLAFTKRMLSSLCETLPADLSIEVIIIDDASNDGTLVWLSSLARDGLKSAKIKLFSFVRNETNLGYAKSNNLAVKGAQGHILALLNNDLELRLGWLEPMLALFEHNKPEPIIVGNLQYRPGTHEPDHAGFVVRVNAESNRPVVEHRREVTSTEPQKVFAVTGACCLIRRQLFERLGGFDERYVNGGEDVDLCMKVLQDKGACWIVPASSVWHHVGQTRGCQEDRDEKNSWRLFQRWHKQISKELERSCAELFVALPHEDPLIKRMASEFISGERSFAPTAVKVMAQKYIQTELERWEGYFHS